MVHLIAIITSLIAHGSRAQIQTLEPIATDRKGTGSGAAISIIIIAVIAGLARIRLAIPITAGDGC